MTGSHRSGVMFLKLLSRRIPALLMTMSMRPKASRDVFTMASAPAVVATLLLSATATPPRASISSTTFWAGPADEPVPSTAPPRSLTTTCAPREASSRACSRPNPPPAPVMIATLPSKPTSDMHPPQRALYLPSTRIRAGDAPVTNNGHARKGEDSPECSAGTVDGHERSPPAHHLRPPRSDPRRRPGPV